MSDWAEVERLEALGLWNEADELRQDLNRRHNDITRLERERRAEREAEKQRRRLAQRFPRPTQQKAPAR